MWQVRDQNIDFCRSAPVNVPIHSEFEVRVIYLSKRDSPQRESKMDPDDKKRENAQKHTLRVFCSHSRKPARYVFACFIIGGGAYRRLSVSPQTRPSNTNTSTNIHGFPPDPSQTSLSITSTVRYRVLPRSTPTRWHKPCHTIILPSTAPRLKPHQPTRKGRFVIDPVPTSRPFLPSNP